MTADMRIVLEKPIGHDYESAKAINDQVGAASQRIRSFALITISAKKPCKIYWRCVLPIPCLSLFGAGR